MELAKKNQEAIKKKLVKSIQKRYISPQTNENKDRKRILANKKQIKKTLNKNNNKNNSRKLKSYKDTLIKKREQASR